MAPRSATAEARAAAREAPPAPLPPPTFTGERQLAAKLAFVTGQVGYIEKRGRNPHFGYRFVQEADLKERISPILSHLHITLVPEVIAHERVEKTKSTVTILTVRWTFHDGDTGETITGQTVGYGDDSGDKGANKAMTAALKFFLIPTFLVVTGDDPEADAATDRRGEGGNVTITSSSVTGVKPGGHTDGVTSTQLAEISVLSRMMELGPEGVRDQVSAVLNVEWDLPDGDDVIKNGALARLLVTLTGEQVGKLISALQAQLALIQDLAEVDEKADKAAEQADLGIGY